MNNKIKYITLEGKGRLERDLQELETVKLPFLVDLLSEAAQGGSSAENTEMQNLQYECDLIGLRIGNLREALKHVTIISFDRSIDSVHIGSTVSIQEENEEPESYMIVGSAEANPAVGMISNISPLGQLLLGKQVGDSVRVETTLDTTHFQILNIHHVESHV